MQISLKPCLRNLGRTGTIGNSENSRKMQSLAEYNNPRLSDLAAPQGFLCGSRPRTNRPVAPADGKIQKWLPKKTLFMHQKKSFIAPAGFRPRGRNPRRHPSVPRVKKKYSIVSMRKFSRFDETRRARWSRLIFSMCAWLSNRANWVCQRVAFAELCPSGYKSSPRKIFHRNSPPVSENADFKFSVNNEGEDVNKKPRSRRNID